MKSNILTPARKFDSGSAQKIILSHCANITLEDDEQVTFLTEDGKEYDVVKKNWGFYATPSINSRLKKFGFKTALVKNSEGQLYIVLVENEKLKDFHFYIQKENSLVLNWLDEA